MRSCVALVVQGRTSRLSSELHGRGVRCMADDSPTPPLTRRVPGAARSGPERSKRPVLPDALIERMQAAVDAARSAQTSSAANVTEVTRPDTSGTDTAIPDPASPGSGGENPQPANGSDESPEPIAEPLPRPRAAPGAVTQGGTAAGQQPAANETTVTPHRPADRPDADRPDEAGPACGPGSRHHAVSARQAGPRGSAAPRHISG